MRRREARRTGGRAEARREPDAVAREDGLAAAARQDGDADARAAHARRHPMDPVKIK